MPDSRVPCIFARFFENAAYASPRRPKRPWTSSALLDGLGLTDADRDLIRWVQVATEGKSLPTEGTRGWRISQDAVSKRPHGVARVGEACW
jgi:hypothetical protein